MELGVCTNSTKGRSHSGKQCAWTHFHDVRSCTLGSWCRAVAMGSVTARSKDASNSTAVHLEPVFLPASS